ncbi:MAG: DsbA family protein [Ilumatobacteraceae bacterium]
MTTVEVFADISCPFAHVGLKRVIAHLDGTFTARSTAPDVIVRAWPLEWVNDAPMQADAVLTKAHALDEQLGTRHFSGLRADRWPTTTLPALALVAAAYERDAATGLAVSLDLRSALFEHGLDVSDADVLTDLARRHDLTPPLDLDHRAAQADYDEGRARGVQGSPHYFVGDQDFFCPTLDLGHDDDGHLTASFDADGLSRFLASVVVASPDSV